MIPGRNPSMVRRILSQNDPLIPTVIKTPSGGRMMASIILSKLMVKMIRLK
jgi:hypothetical protein